MLKIIQRPLSSQQNHFTHKTVCFAVSSLFAFKLEAWILNCQEKIIEINALYMMISLLDVQKL